MKLVIENIEKKFGNKSVLRGASFTFEEGKIYGLLGRNGAGKTTLFNCMNDDTEVNQGTFYLLDGETKIPLLPRDIGYVYSSPVLPEFLTGYEFIKFYLDINQDKIEDMKSVDEYFEMMKISREDRNRLMKNYSHGMKNKMQMLLYMITKPFVLLLDEPLTSLDVVVAQEMKKLLREMKEHRILIFSTHILELATDLCDEIVILNQGKLEQIDHDMIQTEAFEEKIIEALKEEVDV